MASRSIAGNLGRYTYLSDASKYVTMTYFDPLSRVWTHTSDPDGTWVTYGYDVASRRIFMADPGGLTMNSYSVRDELVQQVLPGGYTLTMAYDAVGQRSSLVDPDSGIFSYGYDPTGRSAWVQEPEGGFITLQYDGAGKRTRLFDASGTSREYGYDCDGRLVSQIDRNSGGQPLVTLTDAYDAVGNRALHVQDGVITTWTYDKLYRLTGQQQDQAWATFTYDPAGNLTLKWQQGTAPMTFANDPANRLLWIEQGSLVTTVSFDNNGNQVGENANGALTTNVYDQENRLVQVVNADGTRSTYTYAGGQPVDGEGLRRTAQEPGEAETPFVWDGTDYLGEY